MNLSGKPESNNMAKAPSVIVLLILSALPFSWGVCAVELCCAIPRENIYSVIFLLKNSLYAEPPSERRQETFL